MSSHGRGSWRTIALLSSLILLLTLIVPVGAQESTASSDPPEGTDAVERGEPAADKIEEDLEKVFETEDEAEFLVMFEEDADTSAARGMADWEERGRFVYETLTRHAEETQADVISDLDEMGVDYKSYWIVNVVLVTGTEETVSALAQHPEVKSLVLSVPLEIPQPERVEPDNEVLATEWGLDAINIPEVWDQYGARGEGIVVGVIDSGVQWDHPALIDHYRGNDNGTIDHEYNWYDPTRYCGDPSPAPCDLMDHGTHVTGTIVGDDGGDNQIGVAPEAKFISAVGCDTLPNFCSNEALLGAGQWMAAPTDTEGNNPNPDMRPHIINNSWGGDLGDDKYMEMVDNWIVFGMFPQFSSGNPGPGCGLAGSPGDYPQSYSTGGFDIDGNVYVASGRGPSQIDGGIKPNISGPAVNVRSSVPGDGYANFTGTSMASPHVAGTVAVLWGAAPALVGKIDGTKEILDQTAVDTEDLSCGGEPDNNNVWGEGKLDALAAIEEAPLGDTGTVEGTVTDGDGALIAGATVEFTGPANRTVTTDEDGSYSKLLTVGDYQATARALGFLPETVDVTVTVDTTTNQDFSLEVAPIATVTGTVIDDGGHGWPLYARIDIPEHPDSPFFTDPVTGEYSIELVEGTEFTLEVSAVVPGYLSETRSITIPPDDPVQDFSLDVDVQACIAPGYFADVNGVYETFDLEEVPEGWEVVDNIGNGQTWTFNDPDGRGNLTGGEGNFAIVDSDNYGSAGEQDTELISPPVDYTQLENPSIEFLTDYSDWRDPEIAEVDLSLDNGATWETVWTAPQADLQGLVAVDIPQAADTTEARVRFHYYEASFAYWWQVDNVLLGELLCLPEEAGLVVGTVTDLYTGDPIVGATVSVDDNPDDTTRTVATPEDPALDDGFYILTVHSSGETAITASMNQYTSSTETGTVVADSVVTQDFQLGSGLLSVTPESLTTTLDMGGTDTQELVITNSGSGAANFRISDSVGGFDPAGGSADDSAPAVLDPVDEAAATPPASQPHADPESGESASLEGVEQTGDQPAIQDIEDWDPRAELSGGSVHFARVQCPGEFGGFYKIAGVDTATQISDETSWYEAASDTWTVLAPMPDGGREAPTAACTEDGRIHVIGGTFGGVPTDSHFVYDIASDNWEQAAPAPRTLWAAASAVWDDKLYLVGGSDSTTVGQGNTAEVNVYDIATDTWEDNAEPLPAPNNLMGYVQAGQYLYVVGGSGDNAPIHETTTLRFDMFTGVWESGPEFSSARADLGVAITDTSLYAVGGDADGGGPFDSTNVVEQLDVTAWPDGEWVEATTLPTALTALGAVCAVGDTGPAIHAIGGLAPGPWITTLHSSAPTDEPCETEAVDIPWLDFDRNEGTLEPGESTTVTVTYDTSVPEVHQPGVYTADILVSDDTPHSMPAIPVEMMVNPPANWGKIDVNVEGLEHCDAAGAPLADATVEIGDQSGTTDNDGFFVKWIEEGTYPVSVSADGYIGDSGEATVVAGDIVAIDFSLRPDLPCAEIAPDVFDFEVRPDESDTDEIAFTNDGAGELEFRIIERPAPDDPAPAVLDPVDEAAAAPPVTDRPDDAESGVSASLVGVEQTGDRPVIQDIEDWDPRAELTGGAVHFARVQCPGEFGGFYKIAGVDTASQISDETSWYDAATDTWTVLAPMPGGGREAPTAACTEDGRIHVIGGTSGPATDSHFVYDIASDTWEQAAAGPRIVRGAASAAWNGKLYLVGGSSSVFLGLGMTAEVNVYDIASDTWEADAEPMPVAMEAMGYTQAGQYLYVVGGWGASAPTNNETVTLRFDMDAGVWESGPEFSSARADLGLVVTDSSLYALGGDEDGGGVFDATTMVEQLDVIAWPAGEWVETSTLPSALTALGAACVAGDTGPAIHAIGGIAPGRLITSMHSAAPTDETCNPGGEDSTWLAQDPNEGTVPSESTGTATVTVDTGGLELGEYAAELQVTTNDPASRLVTIPVNLTVVDPTPVIEEAPSVVERGEMVTLVGRNFLEPLEVNFGDSTITDANVISETELTFQVPNNARFGAHVVSVTTPEGTSNEVTMTVLRPGGPSGPVITDYPEQAVRGEMVTLVGDGFGGNVRVNFGDITIRNVDEVSETELTFVVPDNAPLGPTPTSVRAQGRTSNTVSIEVIETPDSGPPITEPSTEPPSTEPPSTEPPSTEPPSTEPPTELPGAVFDDVSEGHLFADNIEWLAGEGITFGCDPPENTMFCPEDSVSRGEMAAFLTRALSLRATDVDHFVDGEGSVFEDDINRLAEAGITRGCNPPDNDLFCVDDAVSRQEMASFLLRGYGFINDDPGGDRFTDDDFSVHEADIEALAASVSRGEMAAFLHRAETIDGSPTSR